LIEYAIFLHGLGQQWRSPQKPNFGTKEGMRMPGRRIHA